MILQTNKEKLSALHIAAFNNADATIRVLLQEEPSLLLFRNASKQTAYAYMAREHEGTYIYS